MIRFPCNTHVLALAAILLTGCGGSYQISRAPNNYGTQADFTRDELMCNQENVFVLSRADDLNQTIYLTDKFIQCMDSKGWKYTRTERQFFPVKKISM